MNNAAGMDQIPAKFLKEVASSFRSQDILIFVLTFWSFRKTA